MMTQEAGLTYEMLKGFAMMVHKFRRLKRAYHYLMSFIVIHMIIR